MFKPLLRIMPSLSGNVKLVNFVNDINRLDEDNYEAYVRLAQLMPLTSSLYTKYLSISLLNSSYEWDLMKFYRIYPQYFYEKLFDFNKYDLKRYSYYNINFNRNSDFEFGVKRISYVKSMGKQFAFFAPIYIESEKDIPDYFKIKVVLKNSMYETTKTLKINIGSNPTHPTNYLGQYIYQYAKKIDDNVVFLNPESNLAIYYGINVNDGGFNKLEDEAIADIFNRQNTITNFDNIICKGFERHKLVLRQILPLCFYFNVNDILDDLEIENMYGARMEITGSYFKGGDEIMMYDFEHDYTFMQPKTLQMNVENGSENYFYPYPLMNIMNMGYPSLHESLFWKYRFTNKISPNITRWKLKYSDDKHPYITNFSPAFSMYQGSSSLYKEFPRTYPNVTAILSKRNHRLNMIFPFGEGKSWYTTKTIRNYQTIRNNFSSSWFDVYDDIEDILNKCVDVNKDQKCMFRGILYNFSYMHNVEAKPMPNFDKFGVFINPCFLPVSEDEITNELYYSNNVILRQNGKYLEKPNCLINDDSLISADNELFNSISSSMKTDEIRHNEIFSYNYNDTGDFIDLRYYDIDWYELNKFYKTEDVKPYIGDNFWSSLDKRSVEGFDIIPIFKTHNVQNVTLSDVYYSDGNSAKVLIEEDVKLPSSTITYEYSLYRKNKFISYQDLCTYMTELLYSYNEAKYLGIRDIAYQREVANRQMGEMTYMLNSYLTTYQFNPILTEPSGEIYTNNVFTANDWASEKFYGDEIPYEDYKSDIDFIYVDTYNFNNIIDHYNNTWLRNSEKLAYFTDVDETFTDPCFNTYWSSNRMTEEDHEAIAEEIYEHHVKYVGPKWKSENLAYCAHYEFCNITCSLNNDDPLTLGIDGDRLYPEKRKITPEDIEEDRREIAKNLSHISSSKDYMKYVTNGNSAIWKKYIETVFKRHNFTTKYLGGWKWNLVNEFSSNTGYTKFLNLLHVKYFIKTLHQTYQMNFGPNTQYGSIDDIYIRRRVLTDDNTVRDIFYKFTDIFYVPQILDEMLESLYEELYFDEKTEMFYFKNLEINNLLRDIEYINGRPVSLTSDNIWIDSSGNPIHGKEISLKHYILKTRYGSKAVDKTFFGDPSLFINSDGTFDPTKCQFELVFKRTLVKVNDDIWNLINLEEKYASPYKDLYLYELETDAELNLNHKILYHDFNGPILQDVKLPNRKVFKPMFNLVELEVKDKTQIYTEYSVHSISKSHINNIYDSYEPDWHFYRHNKNNTNILFDLSWLNKNTPIDIRGTKYIYAYSKLAEDNMEKRYAYFHHTYDKYKNNFINFSNYSTYTYTNQLIDIIAQKEYVNTYSYSYKTSLLMREEYPDAYEYLKDSTEPVSSYDNDTFWRFYDEYEQTLTFAYRTFKPVERVYDYTYIYNYIPSYLIHDDAKLFDKYDLCTYKYTEDGEDKMAAFYIMNVTFNNTINSITMNTYNGEYCKYLSYINGINIQDTPEYVHDNYKRLLPFIKNFPLKHFLQNSKFICKPKLYSVYREYEAEAVNNEHGKLTYYDIKHIDFPTETNTLERYFDNIVPLITETSVLNSYMLKFKDSNQSFEPTYFTNEVIYNHETAINHYPSMKIYHLEDNSYYYHKDREYKFYNDNLYFNLQEHLEYTYPDGLTKFQVQVAEFDSEVFNVFKKVIKTNHTLSTMTDEDIEWAFSQYSVSFEDVSDELDLNVENKLHTLTIKFDLF